MNSNTMLVDGESSWRKWPGRRKYLFLALLIATSLLILASVHRVGSFVHGTSAIKPFSVTNGCVESCAVKKSNNVTIVTAFFNIGTFAKGSPNNLRGPSTYMQWITVYAYIENAVVGYFDDESMAKHFANLRVGKPTEIIIVDRKHTWAFSLQNRTQSIFNQPEYPHNHPKSTNAAYVCAMHAKYELLARTIQEDPFGTSYFAWLDVGLFRDLVSSGDNSSFVITAPACHQRHAVAISKVTEISDKSVEEITRNGVIWISGACLLATADTMLKFCQDYMSRTEDLLTHGLANDDQTIILSMYAPSSNWVAAVPLQGFEAKNFNEWFYIAYLQRQEWLDRKRRLGAGRQPGQRCSYVLYT